MATLGETLSTDTSVYAMGLGAEPSTSAYGTGTLGATLSTADYPPPPTIDYLDPVSPDILNEWTKSAGSDSWALLDDAVRQPDAPTTGSDRITTTTADQVTEVNLGTVTKPGTITTVTAWWHGRNAHSSRSSVNLSLKTGATILASTTVTATSEAWRSVTYTGDLTQAELDALSIRLEYGESGSTTALAIANAVYAEVNY